jgi:hypothetical protein
VATIFRQNGHKQDTQAGIASQTKKEKKHNTSEENLENQIHLEDSGTGT